MTQGKLNQDKEGNRKHLGSRSRKSSRSIELKFLR
jgi:hypothetical protein